MSDLRHIGEVFRSLGLPERVIPRTYREVHIVDALDLQTNRLIALCGTDVTHYPTLTGEPTCVVCNGLEEGERDDS